MKNMYIQITIEIQISRDFASGSVVKTLCSRALIPGQ